LAPPIWEPGRRATATARCMYSSDRSGRG
jgi:hypothetical protein